MSASIAGFKTEVRSGINVTVGSDVAVNFSLTVGAVSEKVEVTAEAPQVDATSSTLGGFVNSTTIRELPLNGRDWLQLALLQPGVNVNGAQNQSDSARAQRGNGLAIDVQDSAPSQFHQDEYIKDTESSRDHRKEGTSNHLGVCSLRLLGLSRSARAGFQDSRFWVNTEGSVASC